jgi:hypothetical protein
MASYYDDRSVKEAAITRLLDSELAVADYPAGGTVLCMPGLYYRRTIEEIERAGLRPAHVVVVDRTAHNKVVYDEYGRQHFEAAFGATSEFQAIELSEALQAVDASYRGLLIDPDGALAPFYTELFGAVIALQTPGYIALTHNVQRPWTYPEALALLGDLLAHEQPYKAFTGAYTTYKATHSRMMRLHLTVTPGQGSHIVDLDHDELFRPQRLSYKEREDLLNKLKYSALRGHETRAQREQDSGPSKRIIYTSL